MGRWCAAAGWHTIGRVWARATRAAVAGALACVALVAVALQAPPATDPTPTDGVEPDVAFGRAIGESGSTWWALGLVLVLALAVACRVATGHRSMRAALEQHGTPTASTAAVRTF
jgi:hypothetical protein